MKIIAIIPARGGSKGIPRKNLRPLKGKPLIYYSIKAALQCTEIDEVIVTTDDDEIALLSERFGANVHYRKKSLADDITTLDPVVFNAISENCSLNNDDVIITIQPTSPLVNELDLSNVINTFKRKKNIDTVISVVDDRHLTWTIKNKMPTPLYTERINRQGLPSCFKETGSIIACTYQQLSRGTRIGINIELYEVPHERSFDIDNYSDFYLCESILKRKLVIINIIGNKISGMGHIYRGLTLANELINYRILFICRESDNLAYQVVKQNNFDILQTEQVNDVITKLQPSLIINDVLDTDKDYIQAQKSIKDCKVINFEDFGSGAQYADCTINALYECNGLPKVYSGPSYFCLRDEFLFPPEPNSQKETITLTFGGIDPANLTLRILKAIEFYHDKFHFDIIIGKGYAHSKELNSYCEDRLNLNIVSSTNKISSYFNNAKIAFTSGGRTVYELASMQVPTITICQNERELLHKFASIENGIINLGIHDKVTDEEIRECFTRLLNNEYRREIINKLSKHKLYNGKKNVIALINKTLEV